MSKKSGRDESDPYFKEGVLAFSFGYTLDSNPYRKESRESVMWISGWIDERTRVRVGSIFQKYGVAWRNSQEGVCRD